jgi:hypothetical protein
MNLNLVVRITELIFNFESSPINSILQAQGYTVVNNIIVCGNSSILYIYVSLTIAFKLVIHVTGLILAFVTRKVKIDPLNDSRYSAALIYISTLFLFGSLVIFLLVEDNNTYAAVWTTYVLAEVCVFLGLNFIPKVSHSACRKVLKRFFSYTNQSVFMHDF